MIFLVGFMGSGKTTVGRILAAKLACPFVDLDDRIEAAAGCAIHEIFDRQGESAFRDIEHEQLKALIAEFQGRDAVIAVGGGAFVQPRNRSLMGDAKIIWLDAPLGILHRRCRDEHTDRPLARDRERFETLYRERLPFYARAHHRIDAIHDPQSVVQEILTVLDL